jgi:PAS domain S-box-containing protein
MHLRPLLRRSFAVRVFTVLFVVTFLGNTASMLALHVQSSKALRAGIEQRSLETAVQASREMSLYVDHSIDELNELGGLLAGLPGGDWNDPVALNGILRHEDRLRWFALVGPDDAVIAEGSSSTDALPLPAPQRIVALLNEVRSMPLGRLVMDDVPGLVVAAPVPSRRGVTLVGDIALDGVWELIDQISAAGTRTARLVTAAGAAVPPPGSKGKEGFTDDAPSLTLPPALPDTGVVRKEQISGGRSYLTAYARIAPLDWVLVVRQPASDAFLPTGLLLRDSLIRVLVGLVVSLLFGLVASRTLSRPLMRLLEGTRIITAGDLGYRIRIRGTEEITKLADSFNDMVESLQSRTVQLTGSEARYRLLTERVNDVIFTLDASGCFTFLSPRLEAITGYLPEKWVGTPFADGLPDRERAPVTSTLRELLDGEGRIDREFHIQVPARDGHRLLMEVHLTADDGAGGEREVYGVARDVTERAELLDRLSQSQKMEAVGRLAGGIAHDFNNLLTAIIGYSDYSILCIDDTDQLRKNLSEIKNAGNHAAGLTRQLLAFSRRQVMKPRVLDLNQLIGSLKDLLVRLLGEDITLETKYAGNLGAVLADPVQVEQVILNLCINARDAMPRGGRIVVETGNAVLEASPDPRYKVATGDYVCMSISDSGAGMDPETLSHLFEPFFTTKELGKGTGLGLSTVYGIVKQTGGYVWVDSEPGRGARFRVYFPRSAGTAEDPKAHTDVTLARGGNESILLVEDDAAIRGLIKSVLGSHGYAVREAENAEAARALFEAPEARFDLVITDVVLPGESGKDLVERLAAAHPDIPALFMSGHAREVVINHGLLHAGLAFMQKPFTPAVLLSKVREILDSRAT